MKTYPMRKWMLVNVGIVDIIDIVIFKCIRHVLMSRCIDPIKTTPKDLEMIWILWLKHMMDTIASLFLPTIRFGIHVSHRLTHIARQLFAIQYHIDNECTKQYQIFFPYLQHRPHSAGALLRGGGGWMVVAFVCLLHIVWEVILFCTSFCSKHCSVRWVVFSQSI